MSFAVTDFPGSQASALFGVDSKEPSRENHVVTPATPGSNSRNASLIEWLSGVLRWFFNFLTYLYLLRFPLIAIAVVALFIFKAKGWGKMLAGAFDQTSFGDVFALGLTDILFVYTLTVVGHNVLGYSALRGSAHKLPLNPTTQTNAWHSTWNWLCLAAALPVPITAWFFSNHQIISGGWFTFAIFLGALAGCMITTAVHVLRRVLVPGGHKKFGEKFPFMLISKSALAGLEEGRGFFAWLTEPVLKFFRQFKYNLTNGYLLKVPGQSGRRLLPGHGLAMAMVAAFSLVYAVIGYNHYGTAIVYLLLLLTWLCWLLSGLAFFLDKYRVPILLTLILFFLVMAWSPDSDHYFQLSDIPKGSDQAVSSEYVLAERPNAPKRPIIVVSANGGGIQSAAWTAKVFTGLTESIPPENRQRFLECIRLISGVSGGSVGTMFFVNEINGPNAAQSMSLKFKDIVQEAEESGLEEVVWGLTYPDLGHAFAPWARHDLLLDRGHALEERWAKTAHEHHSPDLRASLLEWNQGVMQGWRPATIFNATLVESGERLQISTSPVRDIPGRKDGVGRDSGDSPDNRDKKVSLGRQEFFDLFKGDIRIATAARLSASYPYVSPAARPTRESRSALAPGTDRRYAEMHVVDGGFFDNSGLCALTEWLNEGLTERENVWKKTGQQPIPNERILVIEIRGFPAPKPNQDQTTANAAQPLDPLSVVFQRGWIFQLYAPISTMLGVWTSGQQATNVTELDLLQKYWHEKGVDIEPVIFQPDPSAYEKAHGAVPLSWHLRKQDKDSIEAAWKYETDQKKNIQRVAEFITQGR